MKTTHNQIGYTNNIEIIERALREKFGFDDNSHVGRAVAAHIWSNVCQQGTDEKIWAEPEIILAIIQCQERLQKMVDAIKCTVPLCAISYPHAHDSANRKSNLPLMVP